MENLGNANLMMSSKTIAQRTGKQHNHVLRDIRNMIESLSKEGVSINGFSDYQVVTSQLNNLTQEILLNERLCLCLATGYSTQLRMMLIDDWASLKSQVVTKKKFQVPDNLADALQLAANQQREIQAKTKLLEEQQPKVEYADRVASTNDTIDFGTFAKVAKLPYGRNELYKRCRDMKILDRKNVPYQNFINLGVFELKQGIYKKNNGLDGIYTQTLITGKGQQWLLKRLHQSDVIVSNVTTIDSNGHQTVFLNLFQ